MPKCQLFSAPSASYLLMKSLAVLNNRRARTKQNFLICDKGYKSWSQHPHFKWNFKWKLFDCRSLRCNPHFQKLNTEGLCEHPQPAPGEIQRAQLKPLSKIALTCPRLWCREHPADLFQQLSCVRNNIQMSSHNEQLAIFSNASARSQRIL